MWDTTKVHSGAFTASHAQNDMPQAVKTNMFLYPDDPCLIFQGNDVTEIEKQ